ncbi:TlpA family protein disulfide reductase [Desulfosporosinus sp.]|uniref:peroxiredoxin family protein n=1 Tax=Desulfosporosinus sp. TaxID=157907 RepID=UPI002308B323|nr:TlpA family protein disulfide reductase [Desulfosporosinus sp.]MDA8224104.1 redoxin domain-containing protein [Desulfitobacterium hafniense]
MKKYLALIVLIGLVIWGFYDVGTKSNSAGVPSNTDQGQLKIGLEKGDLAPDFELKSIDGKAMKLSSLRGKKVIVNIWATWCPPCRLEMPEMEKFYTTNKNEGVEILAVNLTKAEKSRADVPAFKKAYGITFPIVMDENGDVARLYEVSSIPASFFIDTQGVIREKIVGPMTYDSMKEMLGTIK